MREPPRLLLGPVAEREAQERELLLRGGEQEIALIALLVFGAVQLEAALARQALDVVACGKRPGAQPLSRPVPPPAVVTMSTVDAFQSAKTILFT